MARGPPERVSGLPGVGRALPPPLPLRLRLHRDRGQNFLLGAAQAERLSELSGTGPDDTVIEVGTGLGALTRALASRAKRVVTLEIDSGLVRVLREQSLLPDSVELVHADALDVDFGSWIALADGPVRVVANLPYSVATPLLRLLLDFRSQLVDWSVMVQWEVGKRLLAAPGGRDYSSLSVLHSLCVDVEATAQLGGDRFYPPARVRSAFLRMTPRSPDRLEPSDLENVERLVRAAFNQRRKMLANSLSSFVSKEEGEEIAEVLRLHGIEPGDRPQTVAPPEWLALSRALTIAPSPGAGAC